MGLKKAATKTKQSHNHRERHERRPGKATAGQTFGKILYGEPVNDAELEAAIGEVDGMEDLTPDGGFGNGRKAAYKAKAARELKPVLNGSESIWRARDGSSLMVRAKSFTSQTNLVSVAYVHADKELGTTVLTLQGNDSGNASSKADRDRLGGAIAGFLNDGNRFIDLEEHIDLRQSNTALIRDIEAYEPAEVAAPAVAKTVSSGHDRFTLANHSPRAYTWNSNKGETLVVRPKYVPDPQEEDKLRSRGERQIRHAGQHIVVVEYTGTDGKTQVRELPGNDSGKALKARNLRRTGQVVMGLLNSGHDFSEIPGKYAPSAGSDEVNEDLKRITREPVKAKKPDVTGALEDVTLPFTGKLAYGEHHGEVPVQAVADARVANGVERI